MLWLPLAIPFYLSVVTKDQNLSWCLSLCCAGLQKIRQLAESVIPSQTGSMTRCHTRKKKGGKVFKMKINPASLDWQTCISQMTVLAFIKYVVNCFMKSVMEKNWDIEKFITKDTCDTLTLHHS